MRPRAATSWALLGALIAAGCADAPAPPPDDPSPGSLQGAVLILLDTARADHLSCYGYPRKTSPSLDRLASRGVLFERAVSYSPWTLPSVVALLAGRRADVAYRGERLQQSLVEHFATAGFATAAVTEGGFFSSAFGLDRGFGHYVEEEGAVRLRSIEGPLDDDTARGGIDNTFRLARDWLAANGHDPFFLVIHTYEPHTPYFRQSFTAGLEPGRIGEVFGREMLHALQSGQVRLDAPELEYLAALYDGGILESDRYVGELLEFLETQGIADRTLVVVTSDHGEELGEHYPSHAGDHGHGLHDEQLLVPLIVHDPVRRYPVTRVEHQVRLLDVVPTIADLLGVTLGGGLDGASLVPFMEGTETAGRAAVGGSTKTGPARAFVRHRGYKFIAVLDPLQERPLPDPVPRFQLYDLRRDPGERRNLADERPELTAEFWALLQATATGPPVPAGVPAEADGRLLERLRSLGYVR